MSISKERLQYYEEAKKNRESGNLNGLPLYYTFPKLSTILPSIPKGFQILWTANSGVGKTQSWIAILVYTIYYIKKNHPELNLDIKLVIALLEDTKGMFIDRLNSMMLFYNYGLVIDSMDLQSLNESPLSDDVLKKVELVQKEVDLILEDCEIIDSIYNPTGVYKWARTISNKLGTHHNKKMLFTDESGASKEEEVYSHYIPHNPNQQVILVMDNLNNLAEEAGLTDRQTINRWSRNYCRLQITKHWKWSVINVIQQSASSEQQQFDFKGNSIIEKIKPSLEDVKKLWHVYCLVFVN